MGYTGSYENSSSNVYLLGAGYRLYSPALMRFVSSDDCRGARSGTTIFESEAAREAALEGIRMQGGAAIGDFFLRVTPSAPGSAAERAIATRSRY